MRSDGRRMPHRADATTRPRSARGRGRRQCGGVQPFVERAGVDVERRQGRDLAEPKVAGDLPGLRRAHVESLERVGSCAGLDQRVEDPRPQLVQDRERQIVELHRMTDVRGRCFVSDGGTMMSMASRRPRTEDAPGSPWPEPVEHAHRTERVPAARLALAVSISKSTRRRGRSGAASGRPRRAGLRRC